MKHLQTILFLLISLGIGFGITSGYIYWKNHTWSFEHHQPTLITGEGDAPAFRGFIVKEPLPGGMELSGLIKQWRDLWATTMAIEYGPSLTRERLAAIVKESHAAQMAVVLLPPPVAVAGNPYPTALAGIAQDAQAARVDTLCISWLGEDPDAAYWHGAIAEVRKAFKGKIILAATPEILPMISFWADVDYMGVAGPVRLPRRLPSAPDEFNAHDLRVAWDSQLTTFESLGKKHSKPVALLNIEVPLNVSIKLARPNAGAPRANPELQSMMYESLLIESKGRADFTGMMLLTWGDSKNVNTVNHVNGLLPKLAAAWDPKKPRPVEAAPVDAGDITEPDTGDGAGLEAATGTAAG